MKNRWLFRHSCGLLAEEYIGFMAEKIRGINDKKLKYWKISMRLVVGEYVDRTSTKGEFSSKFSKYLAHHDLRRAIAIGEKLSK